jgi:hypothetical protein
MQLASDRQRQLLAMFPVTPGFGAGCATVDRQGDASSTALARGFECQTWFLHSAIGDVNASYRGSRAQKRGNSSAMTATPRTSAMNATAIAQMSGSAASAEPIRMATPRRMRTPRTMKTTHEASLRVIGGCHTRADFDTDPAGLLPFR